MEEAQLSIEECDDDREDQELFNEYWARDREPRVDPTPEEATEHLKELILGGSWSLD